MNFLNHLMNGCDKKDVTSFSKQNNNFTVNEMTYIDQLENIAEKALLSLLALVVFSLWKHKQEHQASQKMKN